jgi:hypothetical protein
VLDNDEAVRQVARLLERLDEAYPDVGMAPGWASHVDDALTLLGLTPDDVTKAIWTTK